MPGDSRSRKCHRGRARRLRRARGVRLRARFGTRHARRRLSAGPHGFACGSYRQVEGRGLGRAGGSRADRRVRPTDSACPGQPTPARGRSMRSFSRTPAAAPSSSPTRTHRRSSARRAIGGDCSPPTRRAATGSRRQTRRSRPARACSCSTRSRSSRTPRGARRSRCSRDCAAWNNSSPAATSSRSRSGFGRAAGPTAGLRPHRSPASCLRDRATRLPVAASSRSLPASRSNRPGSHRCSRRAR